MITNKSKLAIVSKTIATQRMIPKHDYEVQTSNTLHAFYFLVSRFPLVGGLGADPPYYLKNWLATPSPTQQLTPRFGPKNVDFVIFMEFLAILHKISSH